MILKLVISFLVISFLSISYAADNCVKEGDSIGVFPGAQKCCEGLEAQSPPGSYGGATCVKNKSCVKEGDSVGVFPGAPKCCEGLEAQSPPGNYGGATCVKNQLPSTKNQNDSSKRDPKPLTDIGHSTDSHSSNGVSK
ncbi:MAG: hypothetical protein K2Q18_15545 [Bdellovibrionales bacterium]|nr:hypothetical protein [Bdellovibrionales bacterium]